VGINFKYWSIGGDGLTVKISKNKIKLKFKSATFRLGQARPELKRIKLGRLN